MNNNYTLAHLNTQTIAYIERGTGIPVLLVHGWSGDARRQWAGEILPGAFDTFGYLANHFHVVAPDLRGHGYSLTGNPAAHSGLQLVQDLVDLLDHLGWDSAHVVGYSMGGIVALALADRFPDRVRSLTLGDTLGYPEGSDVDYVRNRAEGMRAGLTFGETLARESSLSHEEVQAIDGLMGPVENREGLAVWADGCIELAVSAESLGQMKMPVFFLTAELGIASQPAAWVDKFPNATYQVVPETNHLSLFLGDALAQGILRFVRMSEEQVEAAATC